jgi:hypothetical protein
MRFTDSAATSKGRELQANPIAGDQRTICDLQTSPKNRALLEPQHGAF